MVEQAGLYDIESKFNILKVFSIIMVVSILLIIYSLVMFLKIVNVIKCDHKAFNVIGLVIIFVFLVSSIAVLASSSSYTKTL